MHGLISLADCARQAERLGERVAENSGSAGSGILMAPSAAAASSAVLQVGWALTSAVWHQGTLVSNLIIGAARVDVRCLVAVDVSS